MNFDLWKTLTSVFGKNVGAATAIVVLTLVIQKDRAHFDAKLDAMSTTSWTIDMEDLRDAWVMLHNPSNNIPVTGDVIRETKSGTRNLLTIRRLTPPTQ